MVVFHKTILEIHGGSEWVESLGFLRPLPVPGLGEGTMHMMRGTMLVE